MGGIEVGTAVTHNVRLVRQIGEGGMGSIWLADHQGLDTEVAVKFIAKDLVKDDPEMAQRFKREAGAAAKIKSPHVVQVFDYGVMEDGIPFIVMELLLGESLGERIADGSVLKPSVAVEIAAQTARALTDAHELGIVHRDIKPDNIFLTQTAGALFVKVVDFGIAKCTEGPMRGYTSTSSVFGTPAYMSPEQMMSTKNVDAQADIWGLAVTCYEMLTARLPFNADTATGMAVAVCTGQLDLPSKWEPGFGDVLDAWSEQAFHVDVEQRFESAADMAAALKDAFPQVSSPLVSLPPSLGAKDEWGRATRRYNPGAGSEDETAVEGEGKGRSSSLAVATTSPNPNSSDRRRGGVTRRDTAGAGSGDEAVAEGFGKGSSTSMDAAGTFPPQKQGDGQRKGVLAAVVGLAVIALVAMAWMRSTGSPTSSEDGASSSPAPTLDAKGGVINAEPSALAAKARAAAAPGPSSTSTSAASASASTGDESAPAKAAVPRKAPPAKAAPAKAPPAKAPPAKAPPKKRAKPKVDCSNPFYMGKDGIRRFKRECL